MLGARPRPPLRRPPPPIVPGERAGFSSPATSPNRWKSQDSDGVGLGIVAALNKSGDHLPKPAAVVVCSPRLCRSGRGPISVACARNLAGGGDWVDADSESYTCVTCRGGHGQSPVTRVYYDGAEVGPRARFELSSSTAKQEESANLHAGGGEKVGFLASDFLSRCYLCHKKLHGKDIYMYRGEKAFCSAECRSQQIASDEYKESCGSEVSKASDVVAVPAYDHGRLFRPGIVAA